MGDFPNPRFEAQNEGDGYQDALDLMKSLRHREPVYAIRDTLTKRYVAVLPAIPTGNESIVWTQDGVDGRRKFLVSALVPPRWVAAKDKVTLSGPAIIQVAGDHPTYQRARARD